MIPLMLLGAHDNLPPHVPLHSRVLLSVLHTGCSRQGNGLCLSRRRWPLAGMMYEALLFDMNALGNIPDKDFTSGAGLVGSSPPPPPREGGAEAETQVPVRQDHLPQANTGSVWLSKPLGPEPLPPPLMSFRGSTVSPSEGISVAWKQTKKAESRPRPGFTATESLGGPSPKMARNEKSRV
jgi:hypothetical protein